jgi:hypothetical protein
MFPNGNYLGADFQWGNPRFYIVSSSYLPSFSIIFFMVYIGSFSFSQHFSIIFSWFVWVFPLFSPHFPCQGLPAGRDAAALPDDRGGGDFRVGNMGKHWEHHL